MTNSSNKSAPHLKPADLAERWGGSVCTRTLANWRACGKGPPFLKLGGRVVYPVASVEEWEAKNMNHADSE